VRRVERYLSKGGVFWWDLMSSGFHEFKDRVVGAITEVDN
jgi:hypothetical protein